MPGSFTAAMTIIESDYLLGDSADEHQRLMSQGRILRPWTERFLRAAGLAPGMSVLDLGCGLGDVSLIAAGIVGPAGRVVGLDQDGSALAKARVRARVEGSTDIVDFQDTTLAAYDDEERFDAVIGRYILLYQPDPAAVLRRFAGLLRPGGIVAFHEIDLRNLGPSWPPCPVWDDALALIAEAFADAGIPPDFGRRLGRTFRDAGLGFPALEVIEPVAGDAGSPVYEWMAQSLRTLAPRLRAMGRNLPEGLDFDAELGGRLRAAVLAAGAQVSGPAQFGAWVRVPNPN